MKKKNSEENEKKRNKMQRKLKVFDIFFLQIVFNN